MTWFINPNPLPYFEIVALEHGYIRAEVNATTFHISVRTTWVFSGGLRVCSMSPYFTVVRANQPCHTWTMPPTSTPRFAPAPGSC